MPDRKLKRDNRLVGKAIRAILVPAIKDLGFTGKYPEFRREHGGEVHFIRIAAAKYGGSFGYSGAWCSAGDFEHWDGKIIAADDVEMAHTQFDNHASVHQMIDLCGTDGSQFRGSVGDFEYRYLIEDEAACRELVEEATGCLPALDHWLKTREAGDCLQIGGAKIGSAQNADLVWQIARNKAELGLY